VGSVKPLRVDVRVVAATNRDLAQAAQEGQFRLDLYARLSLWEAHVPALRQRRVDLFGWIDRLRARFAEERDLRLGPLAFAPDAAEALLLAEWTLNLRAIDRLVRELPSSGSRAWTAADLPPWVLERRVDPLAATVPATATPAAGATKQPIPTREEFIAAFTELDGNVRALARRFGRDRRQIYRWISAYDLTRPDE
jgi:DNA-binding NtrC family response regulator